MAKMLNLKNHRLKREGDLVHRLTYESISHYIAVAEYSLNTEINETKQCYGMPCLLLLCSCIDAISSYYRGTKNPKFTKNGLISTINSKDRFHTFFNIEEIKNKYGHLKDYYIKVLYESFRCICTHNASLSENVRITKDEDKESLISEEEDIITINLPILLNQVKTAFEVLEKDLKLFDKGIKNLIHPESVPLTGATSSIIVKK